MSRWWGPRGYTIASCEVDFREGGAWRVVHKGPDGEEYGFRGEYRAITPPESMVEARDAMLESGMEGGAAETMDRLEEYLEVLRTRSAG
jgi:uncharacterized protein YndB with AHSA1/START domain